jgi:GT2 family glycosyltransferase
LGKTRTYYPRVDVSALVVTWNSAQDIAACIDAALGQEGVDLEVIVVDNASSDDTLTVLAQYADDPRVTVLPQDRNLGYADGNNLAARHATGRHLLLLNPDCEMAPDCAWLLLRHLETTPGCGAAAAQLTFPDGTPQSFARREATVSVTVWAFLETLRRVDIRLMGNRHMLHRIYADVPFDGPTAVDCPAAACVLLPRAVVDDPLLDPRLPLFFNDGDLYRRLRRKGLSAQVVPAASAVHRYGSSVAEVPSARRRAEMVAGLRIYLEQSWPAPLRALLWVLLLLDALVCLPLRRTRTMAIGTLGGLGLPGGAPPWLTPTRPAAAGRTRPAAPRR